MQHTTPLRVLIADDHSLFREALRQVLALEPHVIVVGEAADGEQAMERCRDLQPDVLLLDLCMPRQSGLEILPRIRESCCRTAVVLLTARIEREQVFEALLLGARGVILKSAETDALLDCVRSVAAGGCWYEQGSVGDVVATLRSPGLGCAPRVRTAAVFTERERQIVCAVADGASNAEIGAAFGLSGQTVKNHLTRIFDKTGVSSRVELALYALHHGIGGLLPGEIDVPDRDGIATEPAAV